MTPPERTPAQRTEGAQEQEGEVLISGLDTGPSNAERAVPTQSELEERLLPTHPAEEPTDEDG